MKRVGPGLLTLWLVVGCAAARDDAALISDFAARLSASPACSSQGYQACQRERLAHAYPGSLDVAIANRCIAAAADDPKYRYAVTLVPDTVSAAPEWVGPPAGDAPDWTFAGKRPEGKTYVATLSVSDNYQGEQHTVTWESHLTVRDGVVYWYPKIC